jgi:hypothetical protein
VSLVLSPKLSQTPEAILSHFPDKKGKEMVKDAQILRKGELSLTARSQQLPSDFSSTMLDAILLARLVRFPF